MEINNLQTWNPGVDNLCESIQTLVAKYGKEHKRQMNKYKKINAILLILSGILVLIVGVIETLSFFDICAESTLVIILKTISGFLLGLNMFLLGVIAWYDPSGKEKEHEMTYKRLKVLFMLMESNKKIRYEMRSRPDVFIKNISSTLDNIISIVSPAVDIIGEFEISERRYIELINDIEEDDDLVESTNQLKRVNSVISNNLSVVHDSLFDIESNIFNNS